MARVEDFLRHQVEVRPDAKAIIDSLETAWSFADLNSASDALAEIFTSSGVQPNDRVLLLSENCATAVAVLFACWKIGAVVIPVNVRQTEAEVADIIAHTRPAAMVMTTSVSKDAMAHARRLDAHEISGSFGTLHLAQGTSNPEDDLADVGVLLFTTGTTGDPKGVMLTHDNLRFGGNASCNLRSMTPDDVIYGVLPLTHVFGLVAVIIGACYAGATVRLEPRFLAPILYEAVMDDVTILPAVPQMHALVMQYSKQLGLSKLGSPTLRYVSSGGAPLDPVWKRQAEAFYEVALQNGFGLTETCSGATTTVNSIGSPDISVGPPTPGTEMRIDDTAPGGNGAGEGEVLVRGPNIMKGYYRNPEETAKVLSADGWLKTGDLGRIDAEGRLHILGRSKELIVHGGFNVYPPEVEAALNDHPQVIQSAVIGRNKGGDEQVLAFAQIAQDDPLTTAELRKFVVQKLVWYKRPGKIILATSLPSAPTGKVLKNKLLEAFADQLD